MSARGGLRTVRALGAAPGVVRLVAAYCLFIVSEYAVWAAMLVFAFTQGGATAAGLVALVQLVPAAVLAPFASAVADRRSPWALLVGGYLVQGLGMGVTAAAVLAAGPLPLAVLGAVVASTAVATTRPAQASLVPSLAATADQLTAVNVVLGWVEALGIVAAGLLLGLTLAVGGAGLTFAVGTVLVAVAIALVLPLRAAATPLDAGSPGGPPRVLAGLGEASRSVLRTPAVRLLVALLTAEAVLVGALDVLVVVLAVDTLRLAEAWVGHLNTAYGIGAVLAGAVTPLLIGRRLGAPVVGAVLALAGSLAVLAAGPQVAGTLGLLVLVGMSRSLLDVAARTLLQRTVPAQEVARAFGLAEGLTMAGLAVGSLLAPALVGLGGTSLALLGVAVLLLASAATGGRALLALDAGARVPLVEIALLRSMPLFSALPPPALEGLAAALRLVQVPAGTVLVRQGDPGDTYYAIASGEVEVTQDGLVLRRSSRGEGFGEIALLLERPRTATVAAVSPVTVYELDRATFLAAVTGHAPTRDTAAGIVESRLANRPEGSPGD